MRFLDSTPLGRNRLGDTCSELNFGSGHRSPACPGGVSPCAASPISPCRMLFLDSITALQLGFRRPVNDSVLSPELDLERTIGDKCDQAFDHGSIVEVSFDYSVPDRHSIRTLLSQKIPNLLVVKVASVSDLPKGCDCTAIIEQLIRDVYN